MKPQGILTEQDYQNLASELIDYHDPDNFLDNCERQYIATNRGFYGHLLKAVKSFIFPESALRQTDLVLIPPPDNAKTEKAVKVVERRAELAKQKGLIPFDISDLQFVVRSEEHKTEILPGKTPYLVCCNVTVSCLEGLVPYAPNKSEFEFFAQVFSKPHRFGLDVILPKIIKDPEKLNYFFQALEKRVQELNRIDLKEYFFRCVEIDVNWDIHKDTTGEARFGYLKFGERLEQVKQKVMSQKNVEIPESESKFRYPEFATFSRVLATDYLLGSQLSKHESVPTITETKATSEEKLPPLEDAMKDTKILLVLWKRLSEMDKPFVDEKGKILGGRKARKHREIMALAQLIGKWFKDGYGMFEIYSMLCIVVELDESDRPDKIQIRSGYDDIRLALLSELKDLLK